MELPIYNQEGKQTEGKAELPAKMFGIEEIKPEVIHFVATANLANARRPFAATKTRGEVEGSGKKPWKQKGTGRARAGSIRSPLWRGGGIVFGPRPERNFAKKVNRKTRRLASTLVLSDRVREGRLIILDNLELSEGKTKELIAKLQNLTPLVKGKRILFVIPDKKEKLMRAARNLPLVRIDLAANLNLLDLLWAESILILKDALPVMEKTYLSTK